jgi:hypothetical protein
MDDDKIHRISDIRAKLVVVALDFDQETRLLLDLAVSALDKADTAARMQRNREPKGT